MLKSFLVVHFAASNAGAMNILNQAMKQWTSQTCIRFQQRKYENGYAYFHVGQGYDVINYSIMNRIVFTIAQRKLPRWLVT